MTMILMRMPDDALTVEKGVALQSRTSHTELYHNRAPMRSNVHFRMSFVCAQSHLCHNKRNLCGMEDSDIDELVANVNSLRHLKVLGVHTEVYTHTNTCTYTCAHT